MNIQQKQEIQGNMASLVQEMKLIQEDAVAYRQFDQSREALIAQLLKANGLN